MKTTVMDCRPDDRDELIEKLEYLVGLHGLDYADTYRSTPYEKDYPEHMAKQSCCGVFETTYTCRSGQKYYLGCNYGH